MMQIQPNNRLFLAGKTGSGKTWLAKSLLSSIQRLVVIDPKGTFGGAGLKEPNRLDWWNFGRGRAGRYRILPPVVDKPELWYEDLFERLYGYGNLTIYIDEAYGVVNPGQKPGKWLSALYTRGRERKIGVWAAAQRPAWVPLFLLSESDWIMMFRMNLIEDRQRMASVMGSEVLGRIPDEHGFWLYNVQDEHPQYFRTAVQSSRTGV